jgi:hypothetical protein
MKRMFILVAVALFLAGSLFADEAILIDFSALEADIMSDQDGNPTQNGRTLMDFANVAGGGYTDDQLAVMKTSLALPNWEVRLSASSRTVENIRDSYVRSSDSQQWGKVMGVRVHYPLGPNYAKAWVRPPFDIPAFEPMATVDQDGNIEPAEGDGIVGPSRFEAPAGADGKIDSAQPAYGVVKNVGVLKSVEVLAYGLNFPHGLSVILIDSQGTEKTYFMGYLNYEGWKPLRWNNPQYISEVRNRELRIYPLYPYATPFVKFGGFILHRDADAIGGDFISYFKDVKIIYDRAVADPDSRDINDEAMWHIIYDRETEKKIFEMNRFGKNQVLRYLEEQKRAKEDGFTPTPTTTD